MICHRHSIRLKGFDYSQPGDYFITLCIQHRQCMFGEIQKSKMCINEIGEIIESTLMNIPNRYEFVSIPSHIIMPNHIHAIIKINIPVGAGFSRPNPPSGMTTPGRENPAPTVGNIIAYVKYETTKQINKFRNTQYQKIWQRNYWEHIIRNEKEFYLVEQYIRTNADNWENDKLRI